MLVIASPVLIHFYDICGLDYRTRRFTGQREIVLEVAFVEEASSNLFEGHRLCLFWIGR
jgi:hypothetical protein